MKSRGWLYTNMSAQSEELSLHGFIGGGGEGGNGVMANLTNEKGKFAIAIFRHW